MATADWPSGTPVNYSWPPWPPPTQVWPEGYAQWVSTIAFSEDMWPGEWLPCGSWDFCPAMPLLTLYNAALHLEGKRKARRFIRQLCRYLRATCQPTGD